MAEGRRPPLLVTISGPSGVGKDAVLSGLKAKGLELAHIVTATSRKPRPGEVRGVSYHFMTEEEFLELIAQGRLLEHALVHGDYKGVLKEPVSTALRNSEDAVVQVNVDGAKTIREKIPQVLTVFLKPESLDQLIERRARRGMSDAEIEQRTRDAKREMDCAGWFDHVVVNKDGGLDKTVEEVARIIGAEQARPGREAPVVPE